MGFCLSMYQNVVITDEVLVTDEKGMVEIDFNLDQDILLDTLSKLASTVAKNGKHQNSIDETLKSLKTFVDVNVSKLIRGSVSTDEIMKRQSEQLGKLQADVKAMQLAMVKKEDFDKFDRSMSTSVKKCELFVDEVASGVNAAMTSNMRHFLDAYLPKWFEPQSVKMNQRIADEIEAKADSIRSATFLQMQHVTDKVTEQRLELVALRAHVDKLMAMIDSQKETTASSPTTSKGGHPTAAERRDEAAIASSATVNHMLAKLSAVEALVRDVKARTDRLSSMQDSLAQSIGIKPNSLLSRGKLKPVASAENLVQQQQLQEQQSIRSVPSQQPLPLPQKKDDTSTSSDVEDERPTANFHELSGLREAPEVMRSESPSRWGVVRAAVTSTSPTSEQAGGIFGGGAESTFVGRLKEELLRHNLEMTQAKQKEMQEDMQRFTSALEFKIKEQLADKVSIATLKDHISRNRDQALYANVSKCLAGVDQLKKSKLDVADLVKMLQMKADKNAIDGKVDGNLFRTTVEQMEYRLGEMSTEVKSLKVSTQSLERTTVQTMREVRAVSMLQRGGSAGGGGGGGVTGSPCDTGLVSPRPPVSFSASAGLEAHQPLRRDQSERTLSPPKRQMSKRGSTSADGLKKKQSERQLLPESSAGGETPAGAPAALTSLPSLSHLLFKVDQDDYKALRATTEKEGRPLVMPRPPHDDK